jgi:putative nucleotidyltransferase with HDIG domain
VIRILFVDDEPNILQAMQRSLHGMRNEWSMQFAPGGAEALAMLAAAPVDVIVSDMRMPGMDGWQLLTEVKIRYPQTVRIILSGHAEATSIMRAVGVAHQYIAKPCDGGVVKQAIARTQQLRSILSNADLASLVGRVGMLPSAPQAFQDVLLCLQKPSATVSEIARIIARDVAMTANIMKMVNSAFFGARQPIISTDRAVAYLGLDTLGALVLGHSVFRSGRPTGIAGFTLQSLWAHSLQTGMAARAIAVCEKLPAAEAEKAFLAGVLHDVGKVVFANARASAADATKTDAEKLTYMQSHHAEVGAYLLGLWGFPNPIVEAVAFHHAPSKVSTEALSLADLVHAADQLIHQRQPDTGTQEHGFEAEFARRYDLRERLPQWNAALDAASAEPGTR